MNVRHITTGFAVTGQIAVTDLPEIVKAGYKTIICNRPDGEAPGQPDAAEIEAAAKAHGLKLYYVPIVPGFVTQDNLADFSTAMAEAHSPILAYCASGNRSGNLFGLWQREQSPSRI